MATARIPTLFAISTLALLEPACSEQASVGTGAPPASSTGEPELPDSSSSTDDSPTTSSATTGSTSEAPGADSTSTGASLPCGNGVLDPDEECDEGFELNGNTAFCTDMCKLNICGDGHLLVGHEICDEGEANSDAYGSLCSATCHPAPRCGDNILQPEHEECDHGPDNDTSRGDAQGIACDKECRLKARRGFITSVAFTGDLGGLEKADERCEALAASAGLDDPERFVALLVDSVQTLESRYTSQLGDQLPYVLVTGQKFADSFDTLLSEGPGDAGISRTETGASLLQAFVATDLAPDGSTYVDPLVSTDCGGWQSASKLQFARVGRNAVPLDGPDHAPWKSKKRWISAETVSCNTPMHLYCLER